MKPAPIIVALSTAAYVAAALVTGNPVGIPALAFLVAGLAGVLLIARRERKARRWIVVDGSNVMHWKDNTPDLASVKAVVAGLRRRGYTPGVVFDANAGYKLAGHYQDDAVLARLLGLPEERVLVVPKGTPADPFILATARDLDAPIVTNDRYRDWLETYPEAARPGRLVGGGWRDGRLRLDLAESG